METTNTPKKTASSKVAASTPKTPATPRKTAATPKAPATARTTTAKTSAEAKPATKTSGSSAKQTVTKSATTKTTASKTASTAAKETAPKTATKATTTKTTATKTPSVAAKETAPKTATKATTTKTTATKTSSAAAKETASKTATKKTATRTSSAKPKTTAPKNVTTPKAEVQPSVEAPKAETTTAPKKVPSRKAKPAVKKTPKQATASMNKEDALQSMTSSTKTFTQADKELLESYYQSNINIVKAKKKVKKPIIYKEKANLKGALYVAGANFFAYPISQIQNAKARAKATTGKTFKKPKKKRNSILSILLLLLLFLGLAVGTYFIVTNMNEEKGHIAPEDIVFDGDDLESFGIHVDNYQFGQVIEHRLRLNNNADGIGVYVAFKMEVKEKIGPGSDDRVDIDINVEPSLAGGFNNWTVGEVNGVTYYYYNGVLEPDEKVVLFSNYKLLSGGTLNNSDMRGRTVEVVVTVDVIQEGTFVGDIWEQAPSQWKNDIQNA